MEIVRQTLSRLAWYALWLTGVAYILFFWQQSIGSAPAILVFGRLCGLLGTYLVLWQLVLMSRLPILESAFSFNRLARIHRYNGAIGVGLITMHPICVAIGHAAINNRGIIAQFIDFQLNWEDVFVATVGFALLITIIITTIFRSRLRYELWHAIHLNMYLVIGLVSSHQFSVGSDLAVQPARTFWYMLYVAAFGSIVIFRIALPLYNFRRRGFKVSRTQVEAPNVTSIYIVGRNIERFRYTAGQFAIWRFLTPDLWLQAHPFSFSVAPGGKELRITVKAVGDFTRSLQLIKPGSPVLIDGPHGGFTLAQIRYPRELLFIAGGIGITPLRAMLEALPAGSPSPVLIYAARTRADLALRNELESLLKTKGGRAHYVLSDEVAQGLHTGRLDKVLIAKLVPDVVSRDVLLCGPPPMMRQVRSELRGLGVRQSRIHTERFAF